MSYAQYENQPSHNFAVTDSIYYVHNCFLTLGHIENITLSIWDHNWCGGSNVTVEVIQYPAAEISKTICQTKLYGEFEKDRRIVYDHKKASTYI